MRGAGAAGARRGGRAGTAGPQERVNATWGTMFLRGLAWFFLGIIPFAQIVSFFLFLSGREHRALHDSVASVVVLHDPNKVLKPAV